MDNYAHTVEIHLLSETPCGGWCPPCCAPSLTLREWAAVDSVTLLVTDRLLTVGCAECDTAVLV